MSKKLLENLADELSEVLSSKLRNELELLEHTTVISRGLLARAILTELNFKKDGKDFFPGWALLPEENKEMILEKVESEIQEAMFKIHENALKAQAETKGTSASLVVFPASFSEKSPYIKVTALYPPNTGLKYPLWAGANAKEKTHTSFTAVRELYRDAVKDIFKVISKEISNIRETLKNADPATLTEEQAAFKNSRNTIGSIKNKEGRSRQAGVALEHIEKELVSIKASRADAKFRQLMSQSGLSSGETRSLIKEFGLEVFLEYKSELDITSMKVTVGPYQENAERGRTVEKKVLEERRKALKTLKERLKTQDLGKFGGSDTRIEIEKKKIVKAFNDNLKKSLQKKSINTKIQTSKRKTSRKIKGTVTKSNSNVSFKPGSKKSYPRAESPGSRSTINLTSLIPFINKDLKEQIIKNMGAPGLENRSGRFASSAIVTDIIPTRQGFPSIGYTYQKNPYQVFEQGAGKIPWANSDRDPRKVIDQSIREIARELIVGRFYTRRV